MPNYCLFMYNKVHCYTIYQYVLVIKMSLNNNYSFCQFILGGLLIMLSGCASNPPLVDYMKQGRIDAMKNFLDSGKDPNVTDWKNQTPLLFASSTNNIEAVNLLLKFKADTEIKRSRFNQTPLMVSVIKQHEEVVELLLKAGANPNNVSDNVSGNGGSSLIEAVLKNNKNIVKLLLDYGADTETKGSKSNQTALFVAVIKQHDVIVETLLKAGANPNNAETDSETSALNQAVLKNDISIVKLLLKHGADVTRKTQSGSFALIEAVNSKNVEMTELLIMNDANIDQQDNRGNTALMYAAINGQLEMARLLIDNGADATIVQSNGYTASSLAKKTKHARIVLLIDRGVSLSNRPIQKVSSIITQEDDIRSKYARLRKEFVFKRNKKVNDNSYALIIGINEYIENTNVMHADLSALAFEELAHKTFGLPKENIITLLNGQASSGQLKSKLELAKELAEKGSNLYVYYAGHGVPGKDGSTYLLPSDMSADSIHLEPNLRLDKIYKNLSQSLASNVYVFMDSCFSGKDDNNNLLYKGVAPVLKVNKVKIESKKLTVFTAGKNTDFANDYKDEQYRLFTYYLISELSQGAKDLSAVYEKIRRNVKRSSLMKGIGYKQVPQLYGNSQRELY